MISDVKEKGSLIKVYITSSKRFPSISEDRKVLVGIVSNIFIILNVSLIVLYDKKCIPISYMGKGGFRQHKTF